MFNYVVIGAGFSGAVIARQIAEQLGEKVLVVEKRHHIGGNCYDYLNEHGILVHKYGPHLFHTDNEDVFSFLSRFTDWHLYQHKVLAEIDGQQVPLPFNFNSIEKLFDKTLAAEFISALTKNFEYNTKVPILKLRESKNPLLVQLADYIYEKVYFHFTKKQWGISPDKLSPDVTARVPVLIGRDDRYFQDKYQMMPSQGYTMLFKNMLDHPNIKLMLNTDYSEISSLDINTGDIKLFDTTFKGDFIFTGPIDELFQYCYEALPYRSIKFEFETLQQKIFQKVTTVNYPNNYDFTRITEFKHLQFNSSGYTTIVREYPKDYVPKIDIPYYPIFTDENALRYKQYEQLCSRFQNLHLIGRLAQYRYYDMDDSVAAALKYFEENFS